MNAELYLKKAVLQLAKGLEEKSIESLNKVLETGGDDQMQVRWQAVFSRYLQLRRSFR
mgnify:CR=1 FL=1